jgi:hypothetical protein
VSQQVNLYNPLFERKKKPFSVRTMGVALGFMVLAFVALYTYAAIKTHSAERLAAQLAQQVIVQRDQVTKLAAVPARTPDRSLEAEVARLDAEVRSRQTTLRALATGELGNTAGFSEFLAALGRRAVPGVWLTSVTIGESGNELIVQGRALRADLMPSFLRGLNDEPVMRGRKITEMKLAAKAAPKPAEGNAAREPEAYIEFSLTAPFQLAEGIP